MASISVVKALSGFFNVDTLDPTKPSDKVLLDMGAKGKRPVGTWGDELKAFTPDEKRALAELVVAQTGDTLLKVPAK